MNVTEITIRKKGTGSYIASGVVNGVEVSAHTHDSQAYDYLNDDEEVEMQADAIAHCEHILEEAYIQTLESEI